MVRLAIVPLACVALLAACGGDGGSEKSEQTAIDQEDQELAEASLLRLSDLPAGWTATEAGEEGEDEPECLDELEPDLSDLTITGDAESDDFMSEPAQVGSTVTIYETEEQAQAALDRVFEVLASDELIACFGDSLDELAQAEEDVEIEMGDLSGGAVSFPNVAEQTEAVELEMPFEAAGQTVSTYLDFVGIRQDRGVGLLLAFDVMTPFPPDEQERLARIIAGRLAANGSV